MYAFGRDHALNQHLGHIVAEAGNCIAFPNVYQHHVDAFELKPGARRGGGSLRPAHERAVSVREHNRQVYEVEFNMSEH